MNYTSNEVEPYDFLNFIRHYEGTYTYFRDIQMWMNHLPALKNCYTIEQFRAQMRSDSRFGRKDLRKFNDAIAAFLESKRA